MFYILFLGIKCGIMRFSNHCILFLSTFYTTFSWLRLYIDSWFTEALWSVVGRRTDLVLIYFTLAVNTQTCFTHVSWMRTVISGVCWSKPLRAESGSGIASDGQVYHQQRYVSKIMNGQIFPSDFFLHWWHTLYPKTRMSGFIKLSLLKSGLANTRDHFHRWTGHQSPDLYPVMDLFGCVGKDCTKRSDSPSSVQDLGDKRTWPQT